MFIYGTYIDGRAFFRDGRQKGQEEFHSVLSVEGEGGDMAFASAIISVLCVLCECCA